MELSSDIRAAASSMLCTARGRACMSIFRTLRKLPLTPAVGLGIWRENVCKVAYSTTLSKAWPVCNHDGCSTKASFGIVRGSPMYCKSHKPEHMENVISGRCAHPGGCRSLHPVFNHPGEKKGLFCSKHKEDGMEDVRNRRCACCRSLTPVFNHPGEKKGLYCLKHKLEGMEDVKNRRCKHPGCKSQPAFNYPGENRSSYCGEHKLEGMENVHNRRCAYEGCKTQSVFNYPGIRRGLFCFRHKEDGCRTSVRGKGVLFCSKHRGPVAAKT